MNWISRRRALRRADAIEVLALRLTDGLPNLAYGETEEDEKINREAFENLRRTRDYAARLPRKLTRHHFGRQQAERVAREISDWLAMWHDAKIVQSNETYRRLAYTLEGIALKLTDLASYERGHQP